MKLDNFHYCANPKTGKFQQNIKTPFLQSGVNKTEGLKFYTSIEVKEINGENKLSTKMYTFYPL